MKICVLGLDGAVPEVIFGDERLVNIRRLMDLGVYGRLASVVPADTIPGWMCMCTSREPGSLGAIGSLPESASSPAIAAIWDQLAHNGKTSIIVGVPPNHPPRLIHGISIGCFLTPDPVKDEFTHPPSVKAKLTELCGEYPTDVKDFRTGAKDRVKDEIFAMSRKQWQVVRWLLSEQEWDYFHFVDIGLDRIQQLFWNHFDPRQALYEPGNPYARVISDYCLHVDEQIGAALELMDSETIVLVASAHGNHTPRGMFILAAPNCPLSGEYEGARLLDIAPTLLDLAGYEIAEGMQGRSLIAGLEKKGPGGGQDSEKLIHDRLAGLGYI
jgi:predicted AlkP superfamily phosphohydrolase/phosphomutase